VSRLFDFFRLLFGTLLVVTSWTAWSAEQKPIIIKAFPVPEEVEASAIEQVRQNTKPQVALPGPDVPEKLLTNADALIQQGQAQQAYSLLEPLDMQYAGNVRYDYLLGVAALDSGHPDKATIAFERVLAVDPNFAGARLDMARAYFQLGDLPRAKNEFAALLKQEPPAAARLVIDKYLVVIEAAERARATRYSAYLESSIGRDGNVNNSTSQSQIPVPALGNLVFTLSPTSMKMPASYYTVGTGGDMTHNYSARWGSYAGLDWRQRANDNSAPQFDSNNVDLRTGITLNGEANQFRLGGNYSQFNVAHTKNRDMFGISGDWRHNFGSNLQMNLFAQHNRNRFADPAYQLNDFDQSVSGIGYLQGFESIKTTLFANVNWMSERVLHDRADGNKNGYGARLGAQKVLSDAWEIFGNTGYQMGNYDQSNTAFLTSRADRQYDVLLGAGWHPDKNWTVRSQAMYMKNVSNIAIYGFDRLDLSLTVRRDFR
jgi:tetratricopeptide (TPR) repeat protein